MARPKLKAETEELDKNVLQTTHLNRAIKQFLHLLTLQTRTSLLNSEEEGIMEN